MYTTVVPRAADLAPRHSVVNQWDLLRPLGIEPGAPAIDPVEVAESPAAAAAVEARLLAAGVTAAHTLVVIHVSAGNAFRRWPAPAFEALVAGLVEHDPQRRVILTSGPSDSGPLHIAAATDTPIVALLGPTLAERSKPWRDPRWFAEMVELELPCRPCDQRVCEPGDFRCLTWITPDRVLEATERALAASRM
jgi:ADP-heptose:LPS heptosyltransferase